jgi:hypothetical protein
MAQPSHIFMSHKITFATWHLKTAQPSRRLEIIFESEFVTADFSKLLSRALLTRFEKCGAVRFLFQSGFPFAVSMAVVRTCPQSVSLFKESSLYFLLNYSCITLWKFSSVFAYTKLPTP